MNPNRSLEKNSFKGFTLIELLIAVAVFAAMSVMAYGGLSSVRSNSIHLKVALERIQTVQHAMFVITRDLTQISRRDIRDEFGNRQPYLRTDNIDFLIEFTRSGRRNPAELKRSNLQRVAYKLEEKTLTRIFWPQLDRVQEIAPYETVLLEKVDQVELKYLDQSGEWKTSWPPDNATQQNGAAINPPAAIEIKITVEDWGEITRVLRVNS